MLGKLLKSLFGPSSAVTPPNATTQQAAHAAEVAHAEEAARLNAEAEAAIAANDVERMRAVMRAVDAAHDEVIRKVPTRDLRHAIHADEREQRWVTRQAVEMFEGEPVYHTTPYAMLRKRGDSSGSLRLT